MLYYFEILILGIWVILVDPLAVRILCSLWAGDVPIFLVSPPSCHVQVVSSRPFVGGDAAVSWLICTPVQRENPIVQLF